MDVGEVESADVDVDVEGNPVVDVLVCDVVEPLAVKVVWGDDVLVVWSEVLVSELAVETTWEDRTVYARNPKPAIIRTTAAAITGPLFILDDSPLP